LSVDYPLLQNQDSYYYSFWYSTVLLYPKYKFVHKQDYGYSEGKEYLWDSVVHLGSWNNKNLTTWLQSCSFLLLLKLLQIQYYTARYYYKTLLSNSYLLLSNSIEL